MEMDESQPGSNEQARPMEEEEEEEEDSDDVSITEYTQTMTSMGVDSF